MENWRRRKLGLAEGDFPGAVRLIQLVYIRLIGFILAVIGWVLCPTATGAEEWRVWHPMPGTGAGKIWVGIWGVCFMINPPEAEPTKRQCLEFLEKHWSLAVEIFIAQDLMPLASIVVSLALAFVSFALWKLFHKGRPKKVLLKFLWVGGVLNLLSSFIILIPLFWNMYSTLVNEGIMSPESFHLPYLPHEPNIGFDIYVGISASGFQITSAIFILSEKCWFRSNRVHPIIMVMPKQSNSDTEPCPRCGSAISLEIFRPEKQNFNFLMEYMPAYKYFKQ